MSAEINAKKEFLVNFFIIIITHIYMDSISQEHKNVFAIFLRGFNFKMLVFPLEVIAVFTFFTFLGDTI